MKAYKAILKDLRGWNKQRLVRAKMKQEKNREIEKEFGDYLLETNPLPPEILVDAHIPNIE